jgi:hypothetical protein
MDGLRKTMKHLSQNSRCPGWFEPNTSLRSEALPYELSSRSKWVSSQQMFLFWTLLAAVGLETRTFWIGTMLLLRLCTGEANIANINWDVSVQWQPIAWNTLPRLSIMDGPAGEESGLRCKSRLFQKHQPRSLTRQRLWLVFGRCSIKVSIETPKFQIAALPAFSQSLQGNAATMLIMRPRRLLSTIFQFLLIISQSFGAVRTARVRRRRYINHK